MAAQGAGNNRSSPGPSPLLRLRCDGCGYRASVRVTPERCPMCGESGWLPEGWSPWSALTGDLDGAADASLARDSDRDAFPGVPFT
jgi:hypothetical protein